jgi:hypothetical protein
MVSAADKPSHCAFSSCLPRIQTSQVTDDSELALALAHALVQAGPAPDAAAALGSAEGGGGGGGAGGGGQELLPLDRIAAWYGAWLLSHPFDVGESPSWGAVMRRVHTAMQHSDMQQSSTAVCVH